MTTNNMQKEAFAPLDDKNLVNHLIGHATNSQGHPGTHITGLSDEKTNIPNSNNPAHPVSHYDVQMAKRLQDAGKTLQTDSDNTVKALTRIVNQAGLPDGSELHKTMRGIRDIISMGSVSPITITDLISSLRAAGPASVKGTPFLASYSIMSDSLARKTLHNVLESLKHLVVEKEPPHVDGVAKAISDIAANNGDLNKASASNKNLRELVTSSTAFNKAALSAEQFKAINPNSRNASIKRIASAFLNLT